MFILCILFTIILSLSRVKIRYVIVSAYDEDAERFGMFWCVSAHELMALVSVSTSMLRMVIDHYFCTVGTVIYDITSS